MRKTNSSLIWEELVEAMIVVDYCSGPGEIWSYSPFIARSTNFLRPASAVTDLVSWSAKFEIVLSRNVNNVK